MRNSIHVLNIQKTKLASFLNVIDNGLQTKAVINKIRPHLADPELSDEDLIDYVNQAGTAHEERTTKLKMASHKSQKVSALNYAKEENDLPEKKKGKATT